MVTVVITTTEQSFTLTRAVQFGFFHISDPLPPPPTGFGFSSEVIGTIAQFSLFLREPTVDRWNLDFGDGTSQLIEYRYGPLDIVHVYPNQTATYTVTLSSIINGRPPYLVGLPIAVAHDISITMPARSRGARH
jgi:hypothetical protein